MNVARIARASLTCRVAMGGAASLLLVAALSPGPALAADQGQDPAITILNATMALGKAVTAAATDPGTVVNGLTLRFGSRTAGAYLDQAGRPIVTVTSAADAAEVRAAGAVPKMVTRSAADLARTTSTLRSSVSTPGTGWAVDPATNKVVVWVDSTITGTRMAGLRRTLATQGDATKVERVPGRIRPLIAGGNAIFAGRGRCSLGFNVRDATGARFFLTAGHCGNIAARWTLRDGTPLGTRVSSSFPRNDFALIRYTNTAIAKPGAVTLFGGGPQRDITASGNAVVGRLVARSGSTTGVHTGVVTALNATVNYPEGTVTGLVRTTVCAEPGDSGGPLFAGNTALGLTSGGSGDCRAGGVTFFQPVVEALRDLNVRIY